MQHEISLTAAAAMTERYRDNKEDILKTEYQDADILPLCETFDKTSLLAVLNQTSAASLRIYYGMDVDLKVHAILVAADEEGNDVLPNISLTNSVTGDEGTILEDAQRCPPYCPPASPLNE